MTSFAGYECLMLPPNAVSTWGSKVSRTVDRSENPNGNVITTTRSDAGRDTRTLTWNCLDRAALTALRAVLDARLGQVVPLWIPTYQRDLHVTAMYLGGGPTIDLGTSADEIAGLINGSVPWQYWTAIGAGIPTRWFGQKQVATSLGGGLYELAHGPGFVNDVGGPIPFFGVTSATGLIYSRLMLCRLASDGYRVDVLGKVSVVTAEFTQITRGS